MSKSRGSTASPRSLCRFVHIGLQEWTIAREADFPSRSQRSARSLLGGSSTIPKDGESNGQ